MKIISLPVSSDFCESALIEAHRMIEAEEGPLPILQLVIAVQEQYQVALALATIGRESPDLALRGLANTAQVSTNYLWDCDQWMLMGKTVVVMSEMPS